MCRGDCVSQYTQLSLIVYLWNAEKQSSWPTQGCFPQLDFQPLPLTTSRWEDFGYSQTSATTSR